MVELVDTLGLEPSALRCAGSSPVPGKNSRNHSLRVFFILNKKIPSPNRRGFTPPNGVRVRFYHQISLQFLSKYLLPLRLILLCKEELEFPFMFQ